MKKRALVQALMVFICEECSKWDILYATRFNRMFSVYIKEPPDFYHDESLDFVCPICKVVQQSRCVMRGGSIRNSSHVERLDLARARTTLLYRIMDMEPN